MLHSEDPPKSKMWICQFYSLTKASANYTVHPTIVFLVVNQTIYVSPGITPGLFLLEHRKKVYIEL